MNKKLSINDLTNSNKITNNNNKLDIYSIQPNKEKNDLPLVDELINSIKIRKKKLQNSYQELYKKCIEKIKLFDKNNKNDIIFSVPLYIDDCPFYNSIDCIKFINDELKKFFMDTYIINETSIFITWIYIEQNKEKNNL
jgi:hypothetical protein